MCRSSTQTETGSMNGKLSGTSPGNPTRLFAISKHVKSKPENVSVVPSDQFLKSFPIPALSLFDEELVGIVNCCAVLSIWLPWLLCWTPGNRKVEETAIRGTDTGIIGFGIPVSVPEFPEFP